MTEQAKPRERAEATISFGARFAQSDQFRAVFREGMALVEETASYLDGPGRLEARELQSPLSLTYASESMRLTTRLMQLASWLLVRRAVSEGELTPEEAASEARRVTLPPAPPARDGAKFEALPETLKSLILACDRLTERILTLDAAIHHDAVSAPSAPPHAEAIRRLQDAFGHKPED
jgi:regulator of CtrA degradation